MYVEGFPSQARRVSLRADIWSKAGLTSSYLGVTAHFYSKKDHKRYTINLCVKRMPSPHTAENERQLVEEYWMSGSCHTTKSQSSVGLTWWQHFVGESR